MCQHDFPLLFCALRAMQYFHCEIDGENDVLTTLKTKLELRVFARRKDVWVEMRDDDEDPDLVKYRNGVECPYE